MMKRIRPVFNTEINEASASKFASAAVKLLSVITVVMSVLPVCVLPQARGADGFALVAVSTIDLGGSTITTDSFDSGDPAHSINGLYPFGQPSMVKSNGDVCAGYSITNSMSVGNAYIKGKVRTGPNGTVSLGTNSYVTGGIYNDFNVTFTHAVLRITAWFPVPGTDVTVGGKTYNYFIPTSGDYYMSSFSSTLYIGSNVSVRLVILGDVNMTGSDEIHIAQGARVRLYMAGTNFKATGYGIVNENGNATNFFYYGLPSNTNLILGDNASFTGAIYAPQADFTLGGGGSDAYDFIGASVTKSVTMNGHFNFHYDENLDRVVGFPPTSKCQPPPPGLVGWWPGDGTARDIVGTNNGTPMNGTTFFSGLVGQAFAFDGTNNYVTIPDSPVLNPTGPFSVETWIKAKPQQSDQYGNFLIVDKSHGAVSPASGWVLQGTADGTVGFAVGNGGVDAGPPGYPQVYTVSSVLDDQWHHLAGVYTGTELQIYLDGMLENTLPVSITPTGNNREMEIGRWWGGGTPQRYFGGLIDEVSFYNRALSPSEVAAIYAAGSAGKCKLPRVATASAVLSYDFVVAANITDGGYGYTNTPLVRFIGGGGSGAQAVAVVSNGVVVAVNVLDAGYGYTNAPVVVIEPPFIPNPVLAIAPMSFLSFSNLTVAGDYQLQKFVEWYWTNEPVSFTATDTVYTQMVAGVVGSGDYRLALSPVPSQAFATAQVVNGFVVGATITAGGSGYVTPPAVNITGDAGSNATAVAIIDGGAVTNIIITDAGIGYTNQVTVQIDPPPAAAVSPTVLPMMRLDSASLSPYDNYLIEFEPDLGGAWGNRSGGLFSPIAETDSQFLFITNATGFFRLEYLGTP